MFPAGNYDVTVVLGGTTAGVTSVQAEARRVILGSISTAAGAFSSQTFTVNVRQPEGQPTGQGGTGTPGLDLYFTGSAPRLNGIGIARATSPLVIYLAGDSTVCDQPTAPYTGWGQILPQYFKLGTSIANYADSGENSGSFLASQALFPTMKALIKTNDYVFIQFGHNDKDTDKATYEANLTKMIQGVRQQGGIPILVTPPVRRLFGTNGKLTPTALHVNNLGVDLPAAMKEVAAANNVPLIDLTARSKALVETLGSTASGQLYLTVANDGIADNTHFNAFGAGQMANLVLQGIRDLNLPLVGRLR
jgi:lysophospholipase L1-like esterase